MILKGYGFRLKKIPAEQVSQGFPTKKCENMKKRNVEMYEKIFPFIAGKIIDKDRFYHIYFEWVKPPDILK